MKNFINNYLKIIAMTFTGLVFILASFYLIMNYNHSEEIKKTIYISENDSYYNKHKDILNKISNNLITFRNSNNKNASYKMLYESLSNCYNVLQSEGTYSRINVNNVYTSLEIYNLGNVLQSNVLNTCYVSNLAYLGANNSPKEFKNMSLIVDSYVDSISANVDDSLNEIQNNSSYFYSTNITSATIRNYLTSDYRAIAGSYNDFASIVLYLSEYINGGSND